MIPDTGLSLFDQTINKKGGEKKKEEWMENYSTFYFIYLCLFVSTSSIGIV